MLTKIDKITTPAEKPLKKSLSRYYGWDKKNQKKQVLD
jgi:hypothetical protein